MAYIKRISVILFCLFILMGFSNIVSAQMCGVAGNPIANCGFESGDFTGWVTQDMASPFFPLQVDTAGITPGFGFFVSAPTEGTSAMLNGFDGDGPNTIRVAQDVTLPAGTTNLLFDYRAAWDMLGFIGSTQARTFTVNIEPAGGGANLQSTVILTANPATINLDTGDVAETLDISSFAGQNVRISFDWFIPENFTGPGFFQLDNVAVDFIVTPVPTMNEWGAIIFMVIAGIGAIYFIRRKRTVT